MFQQNVLLVLQENVYCRLSGCTQLIYIIYSASLVGTISRFIIIGYNVVFEFVCYTAVMNKK